MIARASYIDIDYLILRELNKEQIGEFIRKKLIQKDKIDINYYDIITNKITWFEAESFHGRRVYIGYILKRNPCWDTLEEVEERLEIGL